MTAPGEKNIEIVHKLLEKEEINPHCPPRKEVYLEILEALILALVAVSTAWSGFQESQWGGHQTDLFL